MKTPPSLVHALFGEAFQTERSALRHPVIEADRLGDCPPAKAFRAVAAHAAASELELEALAKARGFQSHTVGSAAGELFSITRNRLADFVLTAEQSYRGTLLGMRHGCDLIALFGLAALAENDAELAKWCKSWTDVRGPLVEQCALALAWFAANPERALASAKLQSAG